MKIYWLGLNKGTWHSPLIKFTESEINDLLKLVAGFIIMNKQYNIRIEIYEDDKNILTIKVKNNR